MAKWQNRPLDPVYPVVLIDATHVKIRDGQVANRPIYVALAVATEGNRDILGLWAGDGGEGAKFWRHVLTEIKNRGVNDVLMLVYDGLPDAVGNVRSKTIVQTLSIHNGGVRGFRTATCAVAVRTYADESPSRSRCRPVRPSRGRIVHQPAGAATPVR